MKISFIYLLRLAAVASMLCGPSLLFCSGLLAFRCDMNFLAVVTLCHSRGWKLIFSAIADL